LISCVLSDGVAVSGVTFSNGTETQDVVLSVTGPEGGRGGGEIGGIFAKVDSEKGLGEWHGYTFAADEGRVTDVCVAPGRGGDVAVLTDSGTVGVFRRGVGGEGGGGGETGGGAGGGKKNKKKRKNSRDDDESDNDGQGGDENGAAGGEATASTRNLTVISRGYEGCTAVAFHPDEPLTTLLLARGKAGEVERVRFVGDGGKIVAVVAGSSEVGKEVEEATKGKKKVVNRKEISRMTVGPGQSGIETLEVEEFAEGGGKRRKYEEASSSDDDDASDGDDNDVTIADRLEELNRAMGEEDDDDDDSDDSDNAAENTPTDKSAVKSDSLTALLTQSLATNDDAQLEIVLSQRDPTLLRKTVISLSPSETMSLLGKLTLRIGKKPSRIDRLSPWIQTVLVERASLFVGSEENRRRLGGLRNLIRARTEMMPNLLRLQGRLKLLTGEGVGN